jgi:hypothetical protein
MVCEGERHADDEIVAALGASLKTIARVRKRFVIEGLESAIDRRPQLARPDKIMVKGNMNDDLASGFLSSYTGFLVRGIRPRGVGPGA